MITIQIIHEQFEHSSPKAKSVIAHTNANKQNWHNGPDRFHASMTLYQGNRTQNQCSRTPHIE